MRAPHVLVSWLAAACVTLAACAPEEAEELSGDAALGRSVAQRNGCMSCHGAHGEGGSGPKFVGLADSIVTLQDGHTIVADDAYIFEATVDPNAKRTAGYATTMPSNTLTASEVGQIVAYIGALRGPVAPSK